MPYLYTEDYILSFGEARASGNPKLAKASVSPDEIISSEMRQELIEVISEYLSAKEKPGVVFDLLQKVEPSKRTD